MAIFNAVKISLHSKECVQWIQMNANSIDLDQIAPLGTACSGSTMLAKLSFTFL